MEQALEAHRGEVREEVTEKVWGNKKLRRARLKGLLTPGRGARGAGKARARSARD